MTKVSNEFLVEKFYIYKDQTECGYIENLSILKSDTLKVRMGSEKVSKGGECGGVKVSRMTNREKFGVGKFKRYT